MIGKNLKNKLVMLGSTGVGKTALVARWATATFDNQPKAPTIGASYVQRTAKYKGEEQMIQIWDTAGEERYRSMAPIYASGAFGAVIVFDLTRPETIEEVPQWIKCLDRNAKVPFIIVGNKCDLESERGIDRDRAEKTAAELGVEYFETSAAKGDGVEAAFNFIVEKAFDERTKARQFEVQSDKELVRSDPRKRCSC